MTDTIDADLVLRARANDVRARTEVVRRCQSIIKSEVRRTRIQRSADLDDLRQEAVIAVLVAVSSFDPHHGAPFGAFVRKCIRCRLSDWRFHNASALSLSRSSRTRKLYLAVIFNRPVDADEDWLQAIRVAAAPAVDLDGPLAWKMPPGPSVEEEILERQEGECQRRVVREAMVKLKPRERAIFRLQMEGQTNTDIAWRFGVSRERIRQIGKQVVAKVRDDAEEKAA